VARHLFRSVLVLVLINLLIKPIWIFGVDRKVQVFAGYEAYGQYFSYFSFTVIFAILADAGITLFVQQKLASQSFGGDWFKKAIGYKLWLSLLYAGFAGGVGMLIGLQDFSLLSGLILLQMLLSWISFCRAVLSAQQRFGASSFLSVLDKLLLLVPALWLFYIVYQGAAVTIYLFTWVQVLSAALTLAVAVGLLQRHTALAGTPLKSPSVSFREIAGQSAPFALVVLFMFLHARADGVLLHLLPADGSVQAGRYAAMYRFVDAATVLSYLASGFLLSYWTRHLHQKEMIRETVDRFFRMMMGGAVFVCVLFFFHSTSLQEWLYHTPSAEGASVLQWGMLVLIPYFLVDIFGTLLTAHKRLWEIVFIAVGCSLINLILNFIFIPSAGALAAALIAIGTQGLFAAVLWGISEKRWMIGPAISSIVRVGILATLLVILALALQAGSLAPWYQVAFLLVAWVLLLFILRLFSWQWFFTWQKEP
jgi:O-antigen/teichoic acid export membrane protein